MAKTKEQKEQIVARLKSDFERAKSVVFANFQGLSVAEAEELRGKARESGVGVYVAKKTLLERAAKEAELGDVSPRAFAGGVATFFGFEDEVAPARIVHEFSKDHEVVEIVGGTMEGSAIAVEQIKALALLPGKQELLGKLVGTLNAPVSGFANVLAGNVRGLVTVLDGIRDQKA